jgi:hypothetical protein
MQRVMPDPLHFARWKRAAQRRNNATPSHKPSRARWATTSPTSTRSITSATPPAQAQVNLILLAGLQALRQGDREAAGQAFEQALQQFEAIGRMADAVDQRPFVRRLLAELPLRTPISLEPGNWRCRQYTLHTVCIQMGSASWRHRKHATRFHTESRHSVVETMV